MLNGIRVYSNNPIWRHILSELGAVVTDAPNILDVNFDDIAPNKKISVLQLKSLIVRNMDTSKILHDVFGQNVPTLSNVQEHIIVSLVRSGGMSRLELQNALGYMPGVATHTIGTAIYNLRKLYGRDFIINKDGVYKIGSV